LRFEQGGGGCHFFRRIDTAEKNVRKKKPPATGVAGGPSGDLVSERQPRGAA
jgi:hypothetical protein